jgi:16S rRNA processing protein RimM
MPASRIAGSARDPSARTGRAEGIEIHAPERLVRIGRVGKPHGLDGSFAVEEASESPERFAAGAAVYVEGERARIVSSKRARGRPVIKLDRPARRGAVLEIPRAELPPPDPDSFYVFDLVGLAVEEEGGRALGRVADVVHAPANDVLELDTGRSLPLVDACVKEVDIDRARILVARGFDEPG